MFGGSKKKLEAALSECLAACNAKNYALARKHAEAAVRLAADVKGERELARRAGAIAVNVAIAQGDWPAAQLFQENALAAFCAAEGENSAQAMTLRRGLIDLLTEREHFDEAEALCRDCLTRIPPGALEYFSIQGQLADIIGLNGRWPEAIALWRQTFAAVRKKFGDQTVGAITFARYLGAALADAGVELDEALTLAQASMRGMPQGHELYAGNLLLSGAVIASVLQQRGQANELVTFCDDIARNVSGLKDPPGGELRRASAKLARLRADGLAMLGRLDDALRDYRNNVRTIELDLGLKSPLLVPALEGLARIFRMKGEGLEADNADRRAAAIRTLVSGRKSAPVKSKPLPALEQGPVVWPRRTLAGIFFLTGVTERVVRSMMQAIAPRLDDPELGGLKVVFAQGGSEAAVLAGNWARAWEPRVAVALKRMFAELESAVHLLNSAAVVGATEIEVSAWWAILDGIELAWWKWPEGERERFAQKLFPTLPAWSGDFSAPRWLGTGVEYVEGQPPSVAPYLKLEFVEKKGLLLAGAGPGPLLDTWFLALARQSGLFPAELYARFAAPAPTMPTARA